MGAWDTGTFDNDDALGWLDRLLEAGDDGPVIDALAAVVDAPPGAYLDVDICAEALATAETVAALGGHPGEDVPEALRDWVGLQPQPIVDELLDKHAARALAAIECVTDADRSEIAGLWSASSEHEQWRSGIEDLRTRLAAVVREAST